MGKLITINQIANAKSNDSRALEFEFLNNFESPHTRKCYKRDIMAFLEFFQEVLELGQLVECQRLHIVAYKEFLINSELAPKTINRRLSSISSYFQFLMEKGFLETNPALGVRRPKQVVITETNDLTDEEVERLFNTITTQASPLHKAILVTFFTTGIRKSELINIKLSDLQEVNGEMTLKIRAKGGKQLLKYLLPECCDYIQEYLNDMKNQKREIEPNDWLFQPSINPKNPGQTDRPLVASSIDYIFKKYCKIAQINKNISPHSARATYIGSSLDGGADLLRVSRDVGHSSVKTTENYNKRKDTLRDSPARSLGFLKK
jgi:integrase/recombinase XerD